MTATAGIEEPVMEVAGIGKDIPPLSPSVPPVASSFIHTREPEQSWQSRLWQIAPPSTHKSKFVIWWEAGDPWEPIQRWVIYQVLPYQAYVKGELVDVVPEGIRAQLNGPHPRLSGYYSETYGRWVDGPAPGITKTAWEIHRVHKGWAKPYWIVQGDKGGHRYRAFPWERYMAKLAGRTGDLPLAGDLPYAEPNERTWEQIAQATRWHESGLRAAYMAKKHKSMMSPEEWAEIEKIAKAVSDHIGVRIAEHADELSWAMRKADLVVRGTETQDRDYEAADAEFTEELADSIAGVRPEF